MKQFTKSFRTSEKRPQCQKTTFNTMVCGFKSLILFKRILGKEVETDEEAVEYDLDDEDLVWLELINERRKKEKLKPITEKLLEKGIDRFEKASYFQVNF
jgi:hypothetical protein